MIKRLISVLLVNLMFATSALAQGITLFKDEDGNTNWQHLANWTSGTLIILLTVVIGNLIYSRRALRHSNGSLEQIRQDLERRVEERTATLNESNRLLIESNDNLEGEVSRHLSTAELLQASEFYIKDVLKSMPLMLVGLDKNFQITQWNSYAEKVSGITTDTALGKDLWKVYPIITVNRAQIQQALDSNESVTIEHSQRGMYHFDITIYPLQEGSDEGVVILIDDVSKKVMAENMLIHNDKMSSMSELASSMAHDINIPLKSILFDLESFQGLMVEGEAGTDEAKALLEDAMEKGRSVSSIINNLLIFARGNNDEKQMASVPELMEHAIELAGGMLSISNEHSFKDVVVEREYEDNLPQIPCYVTELQYVFISLFRHACHAMGQSVDEGLEPKIRVTVSECYDALWIKVQHNGVGLSNEEQMDLFEPFFGNAQNLNEYDASNRLSFAYFIVTEQHQGDMAVTSDKQVGSTFHIQIRLK